MEDHLLEIFSGHDTKEIQTTKENLNSELQWSEDALTELSRIPGFVRGKVKRNVEKFASSNQVAVITAETMYLAKESVNA